MFRRLLRDVIFRMPRLIKKYIVMAFNYCYGRYCYRKLNVRESMWPNLHLQSDRTRQDGAAKLGRNIIVMMHSGQLTYLYINCFKSARLKSPDSIIELFTDFNFNERNRLNLFGINFHDIKSRDFAYKKTALKVEPLKYLDLRMGDRVIISDLDILFQDDPFTVFNKEFDVFFTTRHYKYHYPINSGIWGIKVNDKTKQFVTYYIEQLYTRSWSQFREHRMRFNRDPYGYDILLDQDFLCVVYANLEKLPEEIQEINFFDAGFKYNYCPSFDIEGQAAIDDLKSKLGNEEYVVLHLKGELKQVIPAEDLSE